MALSAQTYQGDGSNTDFVLDFTLGYISESHIHVYVDDVEIPQNTLQFILGGGSVRLPTAPASGSEVLVRRIVPNDKLLHDYENGSLVIESNLDESNLQSIMLQHEAVDGFSTGIYGDINFFTEISDSPKDTAESPRGVEQITITGLASLAEEQRDGFETTFNAQFIYKRIGNLSDYSGMSLTEADKLNSYQYPDDSGNWYAPLQGQPFPYMLPSDPTVANSGMVLTSTIGIYQGLWPDTGGSALKGDTYQTQVSGTPTGQYFTALQNTTVDPVGDDVNWRVVVSNQSLGGLTNYQANTFADMVDGITLDGSVVNHSIGQVWVVGGTTYEVVSVSPTMAYDNFAIVNDNGVQVGGELGGYGHLSVYGENGSGVWAIPRTYAQPQTASFKAFLDDYITEYAKPAAVRSYRVNIFTADVDDSSVQGTGSGRIDGKGGGEYYGTNPEIALTSRDGDFEHLRWMTTPVNPANTHMAGLDYYKFKDAQQAWKEGETVEVGQLMMTYGRVIEAQNSGTTGANRPRHGTYAQQVLTVSDGSLYSIGEFVIDTVNPPLRQAKIQNIIGNDLYLQSGTPETWESGWVVGNTLRGLTGLTEQVISASQLVNKDYIGTGEFDVSLENDISFTGRPVDGLIQSDGLIDWKFIDDVKDFVPTNGKLRQILMLGDVKGKVPLMYTDYINQLVSDTMVKSGKKFGFHFENNNDFIYMQRGTSGTFEIVHSNPSYSANKVVISPQSKYFSTAGMSYQKPAGTINDTTIPNVAGISMLTVNYTGSGTLDITGFTGAVPNTELTVRAGNANCVLKQGSGLELGGSDIAMYAGQVVKFAYFGGSKYHLIT